ncbi:tRNA nucleotidyltransferase/poly(A) polymerase, RNA and SrmB- binding domain,Poly A polymerase, head [Cinara cedri]|uniref:tRNA nucleotidyltransferase/poly(A) polymerase, RNA and SrmB- binding domain,Poly A polymerase, head n=1 Tax=Cinara cedri TaxID=506608 RepID=A0A5E4N1N5_9HEMI|nr:tRNA nucleotidyltransferase/poly(A) polymerase, RNA and SrmB- binding domain,Poly A polymerase, head [Cinara cedri]
MMVLFQRFLIRQYIFRSVSFVNPIVNYNLKPRLIPEIMKLEHSQYSFIFSPQLTTVLNIFDKYKYEVRLCGGAVRDILLGKTPTDLDFATTATPDEMVEILEKENIRLVNKGGLKHGTVTSHVDGVNFEITTLRIDVVTDGRHADVEFTKDWKLDAGRRDLTVNSMFLGMDGTVYDYFNGYEDLKKRQIRFVGDAKQRISEDYLRILRYFRFYGRLASAPDLHDEYILESIREKGSGLKQISGERIWSELSKILEGTFGPELMKTILNLGLGSYIGLPEQPNVDEFDNIINRSKGLKLNPITMLIAFLKDSQDMIEFNNRLKFRVFDRDLGLFLIESRHEKWTLDRVKKYKIKIIQNPTKQDALKTYIAQLLMYNNERIILEEFKQWTPLKFPITGNIIKNHGVTGKKVGLIMRKLIEYWADDDFKTNVDELISLIPKAEIELSKDFR